jgi:dipeptidyl aminopeptidase/acylaminoacyl peptidase
MDPVDPEAVHDLTQVRDLALSPSGDRVAYVAREFDPDEDEAVTSVFLVPADGSREPHRLTRASSGAAPVWGPDGDRLGVVMARDRDTAMRVGREDGDDGEGEGGEQSDGDEEEPAPPEGPQPQVWVYDLAMGGDARQVTDRDHGVEAFDWSPDGDRLVVAARDPTDEEARYLAERREDGPVETERLQHKFDGAGWLDSVRSYLFVVDVATGDARRLEEAHSNGLPHQFTGLDPAWGAGDRIAYCSNDREEPDRSHAQDLFTVAPDGTDRRRVTDGDLVAAAPAWDESGERLAFSGMAPDNWYRPAELYVADGDGVRSVSADLDRTLSWGSSPTWVDDALLAAVGDGGRTRPVRCPLDGDPEYLQAPGDETVRWFRVSADGSTAAYLHSTPAGEALRAVPFADLPETPGEARALARPNDGLVEDEPTPSVRRFTVESTYEGPDGTEPAEVETLAFVAPDPDGDDPWAEGGPEERPLVLAIHGGPMAYDEPGFSLDRTFWCSRGYLVLAVNYRGSTSYGREFSETLKGRWNGPEVADLQAAVDAAVDRGWVDPDRLFVTGFSQGGVNTAYLLTETDRFAAAAPEHGIYDLRASFGTDDSQNWLEADFGLPWERPDAYDRASAITEVEAIETPTLVTAGERDWRCPPTQAEQLHVSLRKRGVESKLVVYPDENHGVSTPDRAAHRLETVAAWFDRHDPATGDEDGDDG